MQTQARGILNIGGEQVTCACGATYTTPVVTLGTRAYRHHPMCPSCTATRTSRGAVQVRADNRMAEWRRICPPGYQDTEVSRLPCGMEVAARVEGWRPNDAGRGILISGDTRHGKTRLMWLGARQWIAAGVNVGAIDDPTLSISYSDALGRGEGMDFIADLLRPQVLMWDDFGKAKASDRYRELAYIIVEKRMQQRRPIIVTTQLDGPDSYDLFGDRDGSALVGRLRECCEQVTL